MECIGTCGVWGTRAIECMALECTRYLDGRGVPRQVNDRLELLTPKLPSLDACVVAAREEELACAHGTLVITPSQGVCCATVRGTYGTPEAGTRTAHAQ